MVQKKGLAWDTKLSEAGPIGYAIGVVILGVWLLSCVGCLVLVLV